MLYKYNSNDGSARLLPFMLLFTLVFGVGFGLMFWLH